MDQSFTREVAEEAEMLAESLANVRKRYKETGKITGLPYTVLLSIDPTDSKKYVDWLFKKIYEEYNKDGSIEYRDIEQIATKLRPALRDYINAVRRNLIDVRDINKFKTTDEFISAVEAVAHKKSNSEIKKDKRKQAKAEAVAVYSDDDFSILYPTSIDGSRKYAQGANWCIARQGTAAFWDAYILYDQQLIYFVLSKKRKLGDPKYNVAVVVNKNGEISAVWDYANNAHDNKESDNLEYLKSIFGETKINFNRIFSHDPWIKVARAMNEEKTIAAKQECGELIEQAPLHQMKISLTSKYEDYSLGTIAIDMAYDIFFNDLGLGDDLEFEDYIHLAQEATDEYSGYPIDDITISDDYTSYKVIYKSNPVKFADAVKVVKKLINVAVSMERSYTDIIAELKDAIVRQDEYIPESNFNDMFNNVFKG